MKGSSDTPWSVPRLCCLPTQTAPSSDPDLHQLPEKVQCLEFIQLSANCGSLKKFTSTKAQVSKLAVCSNKSLLHVSVTGWRARARLVLQTLTANHCWQLSDSPGGYFISSIPKQSEHGSAHKFAHVANKEEKRHRLWENTTQGNCCRSSREWKGGVQLHA